MTVCVAVKVHDCIVFAADSASTLSATKPDGSSEVLNVYNSADKVFNLHRGLPLVAMTAGMGHIGGRSISSLAKELRLSLTKGDSALDVESYSVGDVVAAASDFLVMRIHQPATSLRVTIWNSGSAGMAPAMNTVKFGN